MRVAVYVTGHGFGHATRVGEVVRELLRLEPEVRVDIRTGSPPWLYPDDARVRFLDGPLDVGLRQPHALEIDLPGTLEALAEDELTWDARLAREVRWLRGETAGGPIRPSGEPASAVLADVPPIAFPAAAAAGIPAFALANFSWDWVYRSYEPDDSRFGRHATRAASAYARATRLFRLPFHGELGAFPVIEDVPLIARRSRSDRASARRWMGLSQDRPVVLLSFGGLGFDVPVEAIDDLPDVMFVSTSPVAAERENLLVLDGGGLRYEDLLRASDAVVTKPGYGITAEALVNGTRVLYTERGRFPEFGILADALERHGTASFLPLEDLRRGRMAGPLGRLLARPARSLRGSADGARTVARRLLEETG